MAVEAARDCLGGLRAGGAGTVAVRLDHASLRRPAECRASSPTRCIWVRALRVLDVTGSQRAGTSALISALNCGGNVAGRRGRASPGQGGEPAGDALRRRRRGAAGRQRRADRAPRRIAQRNGGFRAPVPFERARPRLRLGRALDPRRGLHEAGAGGTRRPCSNRPASRRRRSRISACRARCRAWCRAWRSAPASPEGAVRDNLAAVCGDTGAAHRAAACWRMRWRRRRPGDLILVAAFGQGCDALLFEVTDAIADARRPQAA